MAGLCGGVAGFERTKHQKAAGLRTYIIVAVEVFPNEIEIVPIKIGLILPDKIICNVIASLI